ncbi:MAG: putative SapB synthase [Solirubrobacteraceae bacterium]|nr:putative SapB synthase [Solirubrobacteraceae bacterium]
MDKGYEMYCLTDPVFYDSFTRRDQDDEFEAARRALPANWRRQQSGDWLGHAPVGGSLPTQGWKIHASACMADAAQIVDTVWDYCVAHEIAFKFIRSPQQFFLRNSKYAGRSASGKLVTIYPSDERQLEAVLNELGTLLEGLSGPYILSDLRWGAGPLFVRYGGFEERYCTGADGAPELAIEDADGVLIPDRRGTTFQVPTWVALPACLSPHLLARNSTTVTDLPYKIERALHFSNGGGVYEGTVLATGERVVLKEGRPHAGLAWDGADAVARLGRERDVLELLAGLDVAPVLHDYFTVGDHHFLVEEFVEGQTLMSQIVHRYPIGTLDDDGAEEIAEYTAWALETCAKVERSVGCLHERGVVFGDLSPANMLVRPDGRLTLIDFEVATHAADEVRQSLATSAFMAPPTHRGLDVDRYALACLRLFVFLPQLTGLCALDPDKVEQLGEHIVEAFPVPPRFVEEAVATIAAARGASGAGARSRPPQLDADPQAWAPARDSMAAAILASATPDRDDRLFPGDPRQFATDGSGLNFAHGAAGVLHALHATGAGRHPEHEDWLVRHATNPPPGTLTGMYDGLHGIAYVLERLGRRDDALHVLDICLETLERSRDKLGLDLYGGLSGIALNLAHFAEQGEPALWDTVWDLAERVADRLGTVDSVPETSGGDKNPYAGLLRGSSGPALMFLRLFEQSGDAALLDLAATALRQDLRRCVVTKHGDLHVDEGWRTLPYVADGSAGIGIVLDDYLAHRDDEQFATAVPQIRRTAKSGFYVGSGLFYGRAGMIVYLTRGMPPGAGAGDRVIAAHLRRLGWHAMRYEGHLAFPGDQLLRLSMDLATGTAGVLFAAGTALHDEQVQLPFLGARRADPLAPSSDLSPMTQGR